MVLHGGSGTGAENLQKACQLGICKVNLANDIKKATIDGLLKEGTDGNAVYNMYPAMDGVSLFTESAKSFIQSVFPVG